MTLEQDVTKRPDWLKVRAPNSDKYFEIKDTLKELKLVTVCQEALCPNIEECWKGGTATFMLMGDVCTRACKFCAVDTGNPKQVLNAKEPEAVGTAISKMNLKYVVITSVNRDDLNDQGAGHFAETVGFIKNNKPELIVEVLAPDFCGKKDLIEKLVLGGPDVYAHNVETVERLTPHVRDRRATYQQSLYVLKTIKEVAATHKRTMLTKSSIMLGLGETDEEVIQTLKDLRSVDCDVVTFGQYLKPTNRSLDVEEFVTPDKFKYWHDFSMELGFAYVASGPLVRSSYKAGEFFIKNILEKRRNLLH